MKNAAGEDLSPGKRLDALAAALQQIHDAGYQDRLGFHLSKNTSWGTIVQIVTELLDEDPEHKE